MDPDGDPGPVTIRGMSAGGGEIFRPLAVRARQSSPTVPFSLKLKVLT